MLFAASESWLDYAVFVVGTVGAAIGWWATRSSTRATERAARREDLVTAGSNLYRELEYWTKRVEDARTEATDLRKEVAKLELLVVQKEQECDERLQRLEARLRGEDG